MHTFNAMTTETTPTVETHRSQEQVAHELGVSLSTVQRRIRSGQIQVIRIGRCVRVPRSEVERLLVNGMP